MAWQFKTNILLGPRSDKLGQTYMQLKIHLVSTGRWRVRGSGDGKAAFQLTGQTAGIAGSYDVFTASTPWMVDGAAWGQANTISNANAWVLLEEIASGRLILIWRDAATGNAEYCRFYAALGCASAGATATAPPALTTSTQLNATTVCTGTPNNENYVNHASEHWLQIGAEDAVRANNGSPFWLASWSRTSNVKAVGMIWGNLSDLDPVITNGVVVAMGSWQNVFGDVGNGSTGAIHAASLWRGGNAWDRVNFAYLSNSSVGASPPLYQQVGSDNKYRTQRPWVLLPGLGTRHIGRLETFYLNKVAREYPTTYDIAGAEPRLTLGHLLVPWTSVVPESSP